MVAKKYFSRALMAWYKKNARDLPWRRTKDPYKIWISEVMLQQTTVATVIPYYLRWVKEFPTVKSVADAPIEKILKSWQGLGYYTRAKNIHRCSKIICEDFNGKLPSDTWLLRKLPGFGPYTTGAVLSIAFGKRHTIIDANVRRVVMRQCAIKGFADTSHDEQIDKFLKEQLPFKDIGSFNQALMELGALVCRNRQPLCVACPVRDGCLAYKKGIQEITPQPKKKVIKTVNAVIGVLENKGKYFIQKRPPKGLLADFWEFPGGKVEKGEELKRALARELKEELGIEIISARHLMDVSHFYTEFRVNLSVWFCKPKTFPMVDKNHRWVGPNEFSRFPMPSGSAKIVGRLLKA